MKEVAAFVKIVATVNVDNINKFLNNINNNLKDKCSYFPCHDLNDDEYDCRTCYCPFYNICSQKALENKKIAFGGYLLKNNILACEKCCFIHKHNVVEFIYKNLDNNIDINTIYDILEEKYINEEDL